MSQQYLPSDVAAYGIDVDALGESLQCHGAHALQSHWAALRFGSAGGVCR
jgi:hypothetical protein